MLNTKKIERLVRQQSKSIARDIESLRKYTEALAENLSDEERAELQARVQTLLGE